MEKLFYDISEVLGVTILHSVWQGLVVYSLVRLALTVLPAASSANKYQLLYVSMVALTVWFGITFFNEAKNYQWLAPQTVNYAPASSLPVLPPNISTQVYSPTFRDSATQLVKTYLPYLSAIYLIVLMINIVRFGISWKKIGSVKSDIGKDEVWQEKVHRFATQLTIAKPVKLGLSGLVDGPCTVGYLKPAILLPIAFTTQLSTQEVEAILLHELAHIKNNDYLYNIIQQMMVVVLFLNPFAQLISRMISSERENRCDDVVIAMTENPIPYARALVKLEEIRYSNMQLAVAATGQKYHLLARIERLIKREKPIVNIKHLLTILLLFVFSVGSLAWLNPEIKHGKLVSLRGAKAVSKLAAIVKSVISKNEEQAVGKRMIIAKTDTAKNAVNIVVPDTITSKQRDTLLEEYYRLTKEVNKEREIYETLPEEHEMLAARAMLDSMHSVKYKELMQPEVAKQNEDRYRKLSGKLIQNRKEHQAEIRDLTNKVQDVFSKHPDMVAYESAYHHGADSILKQIHQATGLDSPAIFKTVGWKN